MRLFFRPHRTRFALIRIIESCFLIHSAAIFDNGDLAACLIFDGLLNEPQRIHVLDLAARAKMAEITCFTEFFIGARCADRHVYIRTQIAVLHIPVTRAQIEHDLAQFRDIGRCLLWAANIGARDDLHQRDTRAVEIHERQGGIHIMDGFACVLLQVDTLNAHNPCRAIAKLDQNLAFAHDRVIQLADLIALRKVRVEIVFAVKGRKQIDFRLQTQPCAHRLGHAGLVDHRQHPWHASIHKGHVRIGFCPKFR